MPTTHAPDLGIVQFMPIESFADPNRGLDQEARVDRLLGDLLEDGPTKAQSISDWPRIHTAIRRSGLFVIETKTPSFTAMLRFCPERPDRGDYEIHRPRDGVERGRTVKVVAVAADETDSHLSMLTPFNTRYAVVTVGLERPHARMMWLVGLRDFRIVEEVGAVDER